MNILVKLPRWFGEEPCLLIPVVTALTSVEEVETFHFGSCVVLTQENFLHCNSDFWIVGFMKAVVSQDGIDDLTLSVSSAQASSPSYCANNQQVWDKS